MGKRIEDVDGLVPKALRGGGLFSSWSDEMLAQMSDAASLVTFSKGETVSRVDEKPSGVFVLSA